VFGAVQSLLDRPPDAAWLIVEAGELKKDSPLKRAFEASRHAASVATYPAEGAQLASMIHSASENAGILVEPAAMEMLAGILGGDRLASRNELEKLFLYVGEKGTITPGDVEAVAADTAELKTDSVIDSALLGDHEALETGMDRLRAEAGSAASLAAQALRHLVQLSAIRAAMDAGQAAASAMESGRPPIFSRRRAAVEAQLKRWTSADLANARRRIADAVAITRYHPALESAATSEALHLLALHARRLRGSTRA
jgi:DNA polymerase-3 subunit delta